MTTRKCKKPEPTPAPFNPRDARDYLGAESQIRELVLTQQTAAMLAAAVKGGATPDTVKAITALHDATERHVTPYMREELHQKYLRATETEEAAKRARAEYYAARDAVWNAVRANIGRL
jgi:imidazolonepropionase-like amidohydrolase